MFPDIAIIALHGIYYCTGYCQHIFIFHRVRYPDRLLNPRFFLQKIKNIQYNFHPLYIFNILHNLIQSLSLSNNMSYHFVMW